MYARMSFFYSARSFSRPPTLLICPLLDFYLRGSDIEGICSPSGINSDNFFGARDGLLFSRFFFSSPQFIRMLLVNRVKNNERR